MLAKITKLIKPTCEHINQSQPNQLCDHCEQVICNQILIWNLKFENMKFEHETPKRVTCGNKLVDLPLCINNLHELMPIVKKFR